MRDILKESLEARALEAPDLSPFRNSLVSEIRRRRRKRRAIIGSVSAITAGLLTTGVLMTLPSMGPDPAEPIESLGQSVIVGCGSRISETASENLPLQLAASLPSAPVKVGDAIPVDMTISNVSGAVQEVKTNGSGAAIFVTKDGRVVATSRKDRSGGLIFTLAPGSTYDYRSMVSLTACESDALDPGQYKVYAIQPFMLGEGFSDDQQTIDIQGGPWDIIVD